ncbi:protein HtrL X6 [Biomphalaria glabrata]|nr:protein HtrL X6 [Biomphalaria glabrata]
MSSKPRHSPISVERASIVSARALRFPQTSAKRALHQSKTRKNGRLPQRYPYSEHSLKGKRDTSDLRIDVANQHFQKEAGCLAFDNLPCSEHLLLRFTSKQHE